MAAAEIRETIVTPVDPIGGHVVQVQISDAPLLDEHTGEIRVLVRAKLPAFEGPLIEQLQREAMRVAQDTLTDLLRRLAQEIQRAGHPLNPTRKL
jgi:hypothetical protein